MNSTHCHSSPAAIPLTVELVDEQSAPVPSSLRAVAVCIHSSTGNDPRTGRGTRENDCATSRSSDGHDSHAEDGVTQADAAIKGVMPPLQP